LAGAGHPAALSARFAAPGRAAGKFFSSVFSQTFAIRSGRAPAADGAIIGAFVVHGTLAPGDPPLAGGGERDRTRGRAGA